MRKCCCGHKYGHHYRRTKLKPCRICSCSMYRPRDNMGMSMSVAENIINIKGIMPI